MSPHESNFAWLEPHRAKVKVASGSLVPATHRGTVELTILDRHSGDELTVSLESVLLVPMLDRCLISADVLNEQSHMVILLAKMASIFFNYCIQHQPTVGVNAPSQCVPIDNDYNVDWTNDELDLAIAEKTVDGHELRTFY